MFDTPLMNKLFSLKYKAKLPIKKMLNKVPEITIFFWIIKILCTTIGETAADYLNMNLHFGLTNTTIVMTVILLIALFFQFKVKKYIPSIYWLTVALLSVVGTLITDNLVDNYGVALQTTTTIFAVALGATFISWFISEKTLSIHTIYTTKREAFYWLAILFTFSLGTAAGDLVAEQLHLGYLVSGFVFGAVIAVIALAYFLFKKYNVLAFWLAYILTRPLGASIGDYLTQTQKYGGLGIGATNISIAFLVTIIVLVGYLSVSRKDEISVDGIV